MSIETIESDIMLDLSVASGIMIDLSVDLSVDLSLDLSVDLLIMYSSLITGRLGSRNFDLRTKNFGCFLRLMLLIDGISMTIGKIVPWKMSMYRYSAWVVIRKLVSGLKENV